MSDSKKPKLSEIEARARNPFPNNTGQMLLGDLPYLLDLVKSMGEALERLTGEFIVMGCGYCTISIEPDGKVTHDASCPIPEARELLKEIEK